MRNVIIFILTLVFLSSCATKYIEVPVDRIREEYKNNISVDTLIISDSSIIREKNDTLFIEKYKYIYRTKEVRDTIVKTDTITKVQTVVQKENKKKANSILNILLVIFSIFIIYKYISKKLW